MKTDAHMTMTMEACSKFSPFYFILYSFCKRRRVHANQVCIQQALLHAFLVLFGQPQGFVFAQLTNFQSMSNETKGKVEFAPKYERIPWQPDPLN